LRVIILLQPAQDDRGVESAGVGENDLHAGLIAKSNFDIPRRLHHFAVWRN
jgi:hypothetical protein